jgi:hypothetical protein
MRWRAWCQRGWKQVGSSKLTSNQLASCADHRCELLGLLSGAQQLNRSVVVESGVRPEQPSLRCVGVVYLGDYAHDLVAVAQALCNSGARRRTIGAGVTPDLLRVGQTSQEGRHPLTEAVLQKASDLSDRQCARLTIQPLRLGRRQSGHVVVFCSRHNNLPYRPTTNHTRKHPSGRLFRNDAKPRQAVSLASFCGLYGLGSVIACYARGKRASI